MKITVIGSPFLMKCIWVVLILGSIAFALICNSIDIIDDAWITFRHSYNFAYKGQLVFNIGERVEGTTSLLWALILGFGARLFSIPVEIAAILFTLIFVSLAAYRTYTIGIDLGLQPPFAIIPVVFTVLTPDYWGAVTNGLEAPLFAFLLVESIYWYLRKKFTASVLALSLLFLTRPEGMGIGLIMLLAILSESSMHRHTKWQITTIFFGIILGTTAFRLLYYGDFLPNPVIAKSADISPSLLLSGYEYAKKFLMNNFHFFVVILISFLHLFRLLFPGGNLIVRLFALNSEGRLVLAVNLAILFSFLVAVRNGGDWMPNYRLLTQYGVLYSVSLIFLVKHRVVSQIVAFTLVFYPFFSSLDNYRASEMLFNTKADSEFWSETTRRLSPYLLPTDVISAEGLGFISYHLRDFYIHDPLGLNDRYIARYGKYPSYYGRTDISYTVWTIQPSIMVWHWTGHLRQLDPVAIDKAYRTYCYGGCDSWEAAVVMIRVDRVGELSRQFSDWTVITIQSLHRVDK